MAADEAMT